MRRRSLLGRVGRASVMGERRWVRGGRVRV